MGDYQVLYLELLKTYWYNPEDGQPSSDEPIYNQEIVKKLISHIIIQIISILLLINELLNFSCLN